MRHHRGLRLATGDAAVRGGSIWPAEWRWTTLADACGFDRGVHDGRMNDTGGQEYRVVVVVGTRPEAIKMLPVVLALMRSPRIVPLVISTGQHSELVAEVFALAGITIDVDLQVRRPGLTLNGLFASVMTKFEEYFMRTFGPPQPGHFVATPRGYPVACLVHGDTASAGAAALAAFHLRIPIVHVEAGLRTSNILSPFPEELYRQLISRLANLDLAPTTHNKDNLTREGIKSTKVFVTGNTAIDALHWAASLDVSLSDPELAAVVADAQVRIVVVTAHRRENWGSGLTRIGQAVARLAAQYEDVRFVVVLHPNPDVAATLRAELDELVNVLLVRPMSYLEFSALLARATLAITDSGGIQEEAPSVGTPVVVVRESTERQEGVTAGTLELVGTDPDRIIAAVSRLLDDPEHYERRVARRNPYGDGRAAERIVAACEHVAFGGEPPGSFGGGFDRVEVLRDAGYTQDPAMFHLADAQPTEDPYAW